MYQKFVGLNVLLVGPKEWEKRPNKSWVGPNVFELGPNDNSSSVGLRNSDDQDGQNGRK